MSDDSVETPIDQTMITGALRRPPSLLPWVLFGVTAGVLAALSVVLLHQISVERERADEQAQAHANQTARAEKAELALTQMRLKVEPLQAQVDALTTERDELSTRVQTLTLEAAKAPPAAVAEVKPAPPVKPAPKKATKKKPTRKKKRR